MGIIADLIDELIEEFSLFQTIIEVILIGGFAYFLLTRYWWKPRQEKKASENKKK